MYKALKKDLIKYKALAVRSASIVNRSQAEQEVASALIALNHWLPAAIGAEMFGPLSRSAIKWAKRSLATENVFIPSLVAAKWFGGAVCLPLAEDRITAICLVLEAEGK